MKTYRTPFAEVLSVCQDALLTADSGLQLLLDGDGDLDIFPFPGA